MKIPIASFFLLISLLSFEGKAATVDTSKIIFTGENQKVTYKKNRKIGEAYFTLYNKTKEEVHCKLVGVFLLEGKSITPFPEGKIYIYAKNKYRKQEFIDLKPRQKVKFKVVFEPFTLYTGSRYRIRTILEVQKIRLKAEAGIEMYKKEKNDPNRFR